MLKKDVLKYEEGRFVLDHWHEGANSINGASGAFLRRQGLRETSRSTPAAGGRSTLCAGIGALAFHVFCRAQYARERGDAQPEIVCIERNPSYVEVGRKAVPEAKWIFADLFDFRVASLGHFHCAIANPPFGTCLSSRRADKESPHGTPL
ncbi:hypothetical protein NLM31_30275 [Bradyrhizobium sp. CCGUVB4N]|uniref:hypothetical protein n=1 Tax=Bradyrhizobium sp. CCGUVB4N TaxID=2949631 RepID=UPI0020B2CCAE|nr:hypothetical protein [Bradyrhizobium sp. CCGUVB4N]MCP3384668.1 hypothetical protein [Bradyrhizobium sp. CCGUVB4N]